MSQLQDIIKAALAKGYSYEDVAALLAEVAIVISPTTLKRYVLTNGSRTTQKQTSSKAKAKRSAKVPDAEPISEEVQPEPEAEPFEASDKPETIPVAKATKGRRKSAVAAQPEVEAEVEKPRQGRPAKTASAQTKAGSTQRSSVTRGRRAAKS